MGVFDLNTSTSSSAAALQDIPIIDMNDEEDGESEYDVGGDYNVKHDEGALNQLLSIGNQQRLSPPTSPSPPHSIKQQENTSNRRVLIEDLY